MLGKLTGEDKANSGLDLARGQSGLLVHTSKLQIAINRARLGQRISERRSVVNFHKGS